jgi:probable HAF family extracellular repeat protein
MRAATWSIGVGTRLIGTLGGSWSSAHDINSNGEVVGTSATSRGDGTAYFWSESAGMRQLPFESRWAVAWAVSDVRLDGTRVVVGTSARYEAMVWIVREP